MVVGTVGHVVVVEIAGPEIAVGIVTAVGLVMTVGVAKIDATVAVVEPVAPNFVANFAGKVAAVAELYFEALEVGGLSKLELKLETVALWKRLEKVDCLMVMDMWSKAAAADF